MHEWALAEAVLDSVEKTAKDEGLTSVRAFTVSVGELQRMELDAFKFSLDTIRKDRPLLSVSELSIETEPASFACKVCGRHWTLRDIKDPDKADEAECIHFIPEMAHVYMRCVQCASPDFEVKKGRGVRVLKITGEQ